MDGIAAPVAWPTRGIIAGNALATSELKAYCLDTIRRTAVAHPRVAFNMHIDDVGMDAIGGTTRELAKVLGRQRMTQRRL